MDERELIPTEPNHSLSNPLDSVHVSTYLLRLRATDWIAGDFSML
jgi:hypothetical protein